MNDIPRMIRSVDDYRAALREAEELQRAPLGTPATAGLQELIEAIIDYESRYGAQGAVLH